MIELPGFDVNCILGDAVIGYTIVWSKVRSAC